MSFYGYTPIPNDYSYVARAGEGFGRAAGAIAGGIAEGVSARKVKSQIDKEQNNFAYELKDAGMVEGKDDNEAFAKALLVANRHIYWNPGLSAADNAKLFAVQREKAYKYLDGEKTKRAQNTNYENLAYGTPTRNSKAMAQADADFSALVGRSGGTQGVSAGDPALTSTQFLTPRNIPGGITAEGVVGDIRSAAEPSPAFPDSRPSKQFLSGHLRSPLSREAGENAAALGEISPEQHKLFAARYDRKDKERERELNDASAEKKYQRDIERKDFEYKRNKDDKAEADKALREFQKELKKMDIDARLKAINMRLAVEREKAKNSNSNSSLYSVAYSLKRNIAETDKEVQQLSALLQKTSKPATKNDAVDGLRKALKLGYSGSDDDIIAYAQNTVASGRKSLASSNVLMAAIEEITGKYLGSNEYGDDENEDEK